MGGTSILLCICTNLSAGFFDKVKKLNPLDAIKEKSSEETKRKEREAQRKAFEVKKKEAEEKRNAEEKVQLTKKGNAYKNISFGDSLKTLKAKTLLLYNASPNSHIRVKDASYNRTIFTENANKEFISILNNEFKNSLYYVQLPKSKVFDGDVYVFSNDKYTKKYDEVISVKLTFEDMNQETLDKKFSAKYSDSRTIKVVDHTTQGAKIRDCISTVKFVSSQNVYTYKKDGIVAIMTAETSRDIIWKPLHELTQKEKSEERKIAMTLNVSLGLGQAMTTQADCRSINKAGFSQLPLFQMNSTIKPQITLVTYDKNRFEALKKRMLNEVNSLNKSQKEATEKAKDSALDF